MNCHNCGAVMELSEARRCFICHHCGTLRFPEPVAEDIRVLGAPAGAPLCPTCNKPLAFATIAERSGHFCEQCRGLLLSREVFVALVQTKRAWASSVPRQPLPLDKRELERETACPGCGRRMETHPYYGPGAVVIDTCPRCDLIWLDTGEMDRIVDAPGRDRGCNYRAGEGGWKGKDEKEEPSDPSPDFRMSGRIDLLKLLFDD